MNPLGSHATIGDAILTIFGVLLWLLATTAALATSVLAFIVTLYVISALV